MARRNIGVGIGVLVFRGNRILLDYRKNKKHCGRALAGSHLEEGESFEECAARELFGETGLKASGFETVAVTNDLFPGVVSRRRPLWEDFLEGKKRFERAAT